MSFSFKYSKSRRLIISGLCCDCPFEHRPITQDVYIGSGVLEGLPAMVKRRDMGKRLVMIADENSYRAAGERTVELFTQAGYVATPFIVNPRSMPNELDVGQALLSMRMDTDFFISLGAGCVTDVTRIVASQTERPMAVIATAPSTIAYPSVYSKYSLKGFVSSLRSVSPELVVCDTDIIMKAPPETVVAGFAEMMSKYLSVADWRVARFINCQKLCQTYAQALLFAADRVLAASGEIARRGETGIQTLMESLVLSGLVVAMTGSPRPVESAEHAIADGCVMGYLAKGEQPASYADILSASVAYCVKAVDRVKKLSQWRADPQLLAAFDVEKELIEGFGPDAEKAAARWQDTLKPFFARQTDAFVKRSPNIKNAFNDVPDAARILSAMTSVGCFSGSVDADVFDRACRYAPYLTGFCGVVCLERLLTRE